MTTSRCSARGHHSAFPVVKPVFTVARVQPVFTVTAEHLFRLVMAGVQPVFVARVYARPPFIWGRANVDQINNQTRR